MSYKEMATEYRDTVKQIGRMPSAMRYTAKWLKMIKRAKFLRSEMDKVKLDIASRHMPYYSNMPL